MDCPARAVGVNCGMKTADHTSDAATTRPGPTTRGGSGRARRAAPAAGLSTAGSWSRPRRSPFSEGMKPREADAGRHHHGGDPDPDATPAPSTDRRRGRPAAAGWGCCRPGTGAGASFRGSPCGDARGGGVVARPARSGTRARRRSEPSACSDLPDAALTAARGFACPFGRSVLVVDPGRPGGQRRRPRALPWSSGSPMTSIATAVIHPDDDQHRDRGAHRAARTRPHQQGQRDDAGDGAVAGAASPPARRYRRADRKQQPMMDTNAIGGATACTAACQLSSGMPGPVPGGKPRPGSPTNTPATTRLAP